MSEGRTALKAYECLYIVHPAAQEAELKGSSEKYGKIITDNEGTLNKAEILGKRQLAYRINNVREGSYILLRFEGENKTLDELEHNMRVDDRIFRYMVTYEIPEGVGRSDELMVLTEKKDRPRRGGGGRRRFNRDDGGGGGGGGGGRYRRDDHDDRDDRGGRDRGPAPAPAAPEAKADSAPAAESPAPAKEGGTE
jgi:small subunit ribosomal protein S6